MANCSRKRSRILQKKSETIKSPVGVRNGNVDVSSRAEIMDLRKQLSASKEDFDVINCEKAYLQEKLATVVRKIFQNTELPESTQLVLNAKQNTLDQFPLNIILEQLSILIAGKEVRETDNLATRIEDLETRVTQQAQAIEILVAERQTAKNDLDHFDSGTVVLYTCPDTNSGHLVPSENVFVANLHDYAIPQSCSVSEEVVDHHHQPAESEKLLERPHQPVIEVQSEGFEPVTYTLASGSSRRGGDLLKDSLGYKYTRKIDKRRKNPGWRCCMRSSKVACRATVIEYGGQYRRCGLDHICKATDRDASVEDVHSDQHTEHQDISDSDQDHLTVIHQLSEPDTPVGLGSAQEDRSHEDKPVTEPLNVVVELIHQESSPPLVQPETDGSITYTVITNFTTHGRDILIDSLGYKYTKKVDKRRKTASWRCSVRNSRVRCRATVAERSGLYQQGVYDHECGSAMPGCDKVAIIRRDAKIAATKRPLVSATQIVQEVMLKNINDEEFHLGPPIMHKLRNIARQITNKRKKLQHVCS